TDDNTIKINKDISLPKFDIHANIEYFVNANIGIRVLVQQNISLECGIGHSFYYGDETLFNIGINYHLPFWHSLALSLNLKHINTDYNHFTFFLSYIPLSRLHFNLNLRVGISLIYRRIGIYETLKYKNTYFDPVIGFSFSFP
ncbi:MAG: hypothetical protein QG635_147, partial [Bacteroidota bacterium]|nr:hypothetical protein [Bacteroidota bacterium]